MDLDWNLCQKNTTKPLKCPLRNPIASGDQTGPYESFLINVGQFRTINALPTPIFFNLMKVQETLQRTMCLGINVAI